jgi:hypothetical protein
VQGSLAFCGTYAVSNDTLVLRIEAGTYPNEEGAKQRRALTLNPTVSTGVATLHRVH